MTFGSRPPTAPEKRSEKEGDEYRTPMQDSNFDADNSMVHMGAITADRKNNLIGNAFQQPNFNVLDDSTPQ